MPSQAVFATIFSPPPEAAQALLSLIHILEELPAPDAVFVGGSGGELEDIFKIILKKNSHVRIVITAVTLETVQEACLLYTSRQCADGTDENTGTFR